MAGLWDDVELGIAGEEKDKEELQEFYEQTCYLDLDDDDFKEPYIVTVHVKSRKCVRIVAGYSKDSVVIEKGKVKKIPRIQMYTKYGFIPSPDGSFYDFGFGQLIGPLSDSVDTAINQLIDAGTLANQQGGFIRDGVSVGTQRGSIKWERGEFKRVKLPSNQSLNDSIFQLKFPEPSLVLFQLLGTLIQAAKDVTSVQDIMMGGNANDNEKATTSMIRVEQGMKVFSSIYKRIYRSLKQEFKKLFFLNAEYLPMEQYFTVLDTQKPAKVVLQDYTGDATDIQPVADPQLATSMLAFAKNQQLLGVMQHPLVDDEEVLRRFFEGLEIPAPERLIIPPEKRQPAPDPKLMLEVHKAATDHMVAKGKLIRDLADAIDKLASAESREKGTQLQLYMAIMQQLGLGNENTGNNAGTPGIGSGIAQGGNAGLSTGGY